MEENSSKCGKNSEVIHWWPGDIRIREKTSLHVYIEIGDPGI